MDQLSRGKRLIACYTLFVIIRTNLCVVQTCRECEPTASPSGVPTSGPSSEPTVVPSASPSLAYCDDSLTYRFFYDGRERSCGYIRYYRQDLIPTLCVEGNPVNDECVESCGHCSDDCNDIDPNAPVYIDSTYGIKSCQWVAASHYRVADFCNPDHDAVWNSCKEVSGQDVSMCEMFSICPTHIVWQTCENCD